jgi:two-component system OmpR family response regulator
MASPRVLLIEDDDLVRRLVADCLRSDGMAVVEASGFAAARDAFASSQPEVAVVDLMLGDGSGLDLVREASQAGICVIVLSARGSSPDRILGLELGAHDYLIKPVEPRELALRIRRLVALVDAARAGNAGGTVLAFRDFELDTALLRLRHKTLGNVPLTGTQYRLLELFVRHPNRVLERDTLCTRIADRSPADRGPAGRSRAIDVLVSKTRARIDVPGQPTLIKSIRGKGYVFAAEVRRLNRSVDT